VELYVFQALMGALMFGVGAMFYKWNAHIQGNDNYFFVALYSTGALCFFIIGYNEIHLFGGIEYYISAALIALGVAGGNYYFAKGLRLGPAGLTSAFAKANIVIVILISAFYYGEWLTQNELLGIISFLLAMLMVNLKIGKSEKSTSRKWFLTMLACMVLIAFRNGGLKVINEIGLSSALVMALAYLFCVLIFGASIKRSYGGIHPTKSLNPKVLILGSITGILSFSGLYFYISALSTGPAGVVVTIFSLDMIFVLLMSYVIYGERLTLSQLIGFILSGLGFVLLGIK
jgi:uncharacterized membrane protein